MIVQWSLRSIPLEDLIARPPRWMLYHKLSREEFLRVFPGGANLDHRYPKIEEWIEKNYRQERKLTSLSGYDLWKRERPELTAYQTGAKEPTSGSQQPF